MQHYNENNIFNKILNKEVDCEKIHEDKNSLSFNDINKQAPVHVLTIPKNKYSNFTSFIESASDEERMEVLKDWRKNKRKIAHDKDIKSNEQPLKNAVNNLLKGIAHE